MNAAPATSQVRSVFEVALRQELLASGLFAELEVGGTDAEDHLLVAIGSFRADAGDAEVAAAVELAWATVAFHHWQAGAFLVEDGHVELQAATLDRPAGRYVTLHLVAERLPAPVATDTVLPRQRYEAAPVRALASV